MKKAARKKILHLLDAFLAAAILTAIAATDWTDIPEYMASDKFYQSSSEKSSDIIIIGIDKTTLSKLGPNDSITRSDFAKVINYLNNHDPAARPAVIGIDGAFTGEKSENSEGDRQLVAAAARYGNVVVASEVNVTHDEPAEGENIYSAWEKSWEWFPPFPALAESVETGHIHAPDEIDGVARHGLLFVNVKDFGRLYSLSRVIYEKYCRQKNIQPNPPPRTSDNGIFYLPFTAKNYSIDKNFSDLLEGNVDSEVYRDKIVLIGPYAPGMKDAMPTALDRSDLMFGLDIHANTIEAFQKNFFVYEVEKLPQLVILFIVSFFAEFYFRSGKMQNVVCAWFVLTVGWIVLCKFFYWQGLLLKVTWIPLAVTVLFIGSVATNYILANAEKDLVTETFGRYVDPTIMNQLLKGDPENLDVGGKLHNIAVLFVDIRGFTTMSEQLEPTTVVKILNEYLTLTTECIRKHHGTLDKFVGDCTMAFWNAPIEQKDSVYLACRAAMDMIAGSEKLRVKLLEEYGREISFGIGVHWGSAVVGNIGSAFRMDYTAIGDTVNTAARLEANAKGGTILISRVVADILGSRADVTSLGNTIKLKGKSNDFEILKLNALKEMSDDND